MGESKKDALRVNFDRKLKLEFHGVKVISDTGLLAYREIDDVFGLTDMAAKNILERNSKILNFRDTLNSLSEKKPSGVARLKYTIVYGKSQ